MSAPITARTISDACDAKPLAKFGSATVQRVVIRPVTVKVADLSSLTQESK